MKRLVIVAIAAIALALPAHAQRRAPERILLLREAAISSRQIGTSPRC